MAGAIFLFEQVWLICYISLDTGRELNVHKKFRRRSGRLPKKCMFSLRPVSWGIFKYVGQIRAHIQIDLTHGMRVMF